jgi:hypothetical protein
MLHPQFFSRSLTAAAGVLLCVSWATWAENAPHTRVDRSPSWTPGQLVLAGAGCPIETTDGLSLMVASGRAGGIGGLDIWVIDRASVGAPWSAPKNLPEPINSPAADFCPAPVGRTLYFVSAEANPATCGGGADGGDIYRSRQSPAGDWSEPEHLPCAPDGPNTPGTERSPSLVETWYGTFLFFSTNAGVVGAKEDIYVSAMDEAGQFGSGNIVSGLSTPDSQDQMPTVRAINGRFEITFNSDRPGTLGGQDAYWASARYLPFWWSVPRNAGPNVNTAGNETRASLSADGSRLYVGRGDVYVSERR